MRCKQSRTRFLPYPGGLTIAIILFVIHGISNAQHAVVHSYFDWMTGIEDSTEFRNKNLTLGFQFGRSDIALFQVSQFQSETHLFEAKLGYEDIYSLKYKNPNNFVNYFGVEIYGGVSHKPDETNLLSVEGFRAGFRLMRGIGYNVDNTFIIPYFVGGMNRQYIDVDKKDLSDVYDDSYTPQEKLYSGSHREAGLMIKLSNGVGFSVAYNTNLYSKKASLVPRFASWGLEYITTYAVSKGIYYLCSESKLFPIWDFIARSALGLAVLSLKRKEAYFPFGGEHDFSMNSFKIGFNYTIDIGF